jgi:hypothetical protein
MTVWPIGRTRLSREISSSLTKRNRLLSPSMTALTAVIPVTEVILARAPRALEGEVKGGSSLEGAGKGRLWRKGSREGVDQGAQRVDALLSHLSCL